MMRFLFTFASIDLMSRDPRMFGKLSLLSLSILASPAVAQDPAPASAPASDSTAPAVSTITARELGGHMKFLASDLMKGRDTASPEILLAGEYLASRLFAAGAEPAGEPGRGGKTYFQSFPLEVVTPKAEGTSLSLSIERDGAKLAIPCTLDKDFTMFPRGVVPGDIEAQVVFGGYMQAGEAETEAFSKLEVKNRFVLFYPGNKPGEPSKGNKMEDARTRGALGILMIQPPSSRAPGPRNARMFGSAFGRPSMTLGAAPFSIPTINVNEGIRDRIFRALGSTSGPEKPEVLEGVRAHFTYAADKEIKSDRNVLGMFPGTDPEKKKEVIIYSAHYDHVGVDDKGVIFNGSDDNASGTSALLEIAEAIGEGPRPARTVVFLWVSGEEKGLLGSEWFADHTTLPSDYKIVADINLDMVSRNDGKKIGVTPSPKHPDYSTLIPAAQEACKAEELEAVFDADQFYGRTDSFNFAKKGIPVIFFFCGIHADYHQSTDDTDKADFEKSARVARAAYRLGYKMAQAPDVPSKIKAEKTASAEGDSAKK